MKKYLCIPFIADSFVIKGTGWLSVCQPGFRGLVWCHKYLFWTEKSPATYLCPIIIFPCSDLLPWLLQVGFFEPGNRRFNAFLGLALVFPGASTPSGGESALSRIGGDANFSVADLYTVNSCTENRQWHSLAIKHIGTGSDTLGFLMVIDTSVTSVLEWSGDLDAPARLHLPYNCEQFRRHFYTTVTLPFVINHPEIETDTMLTFIIVNGDINNYFPGRRSELLSHRWYQTWQFVDWQRRWWLCS